MSNALGSSRQYLRVAMLLFPGVDILDLAGPLEIFSHVSHSSDYTKPDPAFHVTFVASSAVIQTSTQLKVLRDLSIDEGIAKSKEFDLLVVPGGPPQVIMPLVKSTSPELEFVKTFGNNNLGEGHTARTVLSICTGALFLGAAGFLGNMRATTHHLFLEELRCICKAAGKEETEIVEARYIDGGVTKNGVRIISAGGVSSGLDASCFLVAELYGKDKANFVAKMVEYDWKMNVA